MKKNFLQDVIPSSSKRSIRDIPLPTHKNTTRSVKKHAEERVTRETEERYEEPVVPIREEKTEEYDEEEIYTEIKPRTSKKKKGGSLGKKIFTGIIIGFVLFVGIFISRTHATITITPKKVTQDINIVIPLDTTGSLATKTQISKTATKT
jgi:hypothetical protein